jgi:CheY-like chemotaxis protein
MIPGHGLGLAIAKDLAQLMGGEISVASEIGRGSIFRLGLPLRLDLQDWAGAADEAIPDEAAGELEAGCGYRVLIAEDHPINLKLALALLQAAGCQTHVAENGREALAALENDGFDLIVMDSHMPVMSGIDAIKAIRRRSDWKCRIPILSLTAHAMKGAEEYHAMAGADLYMSKPLRSDRFVAAVKQLAERGRELRETRG